MTILLGQFIFLMVSSSLKVDKEVFDAVSSDRDFSELINSIAQAQTIKARLLFGLFIVAQGVTFVQLVEYCSVGTHVGKFWAVVGCVLFSQLVV